MGKIILPKVMSESEDSDRKFYQEVSETMRQMQEALIMNRVQIEEEYYNSMEAVTCMPSELVMNGLRFHIICEGSTRKKKIDFHVRRDGKFFIFFLFFNLSTGNWEQFSSHETKKGDLEDVAFPYIIKLMD